MNIAYTKSYLDYRDSTNVFFCPDNLIETQYLTINEQYKRKVNYYQGIFDSRSIYATESILFNQTGTFLYSWRNLDNDGEFCKLIHHQNKKEYLVFRCDLYGYSVFDLTNKKDFHFYPKESYPIESNDKFSETFIWTDVFYHAKTNLLIVTGCFWACPSDVIILDFSDPMLEHPYLHLHEKLDKEYEIYDGLEFVEFSKDGLLLTGQNLNTKQKDSILLSYKTLYTWLSSLPY